MTQPSAGQPRGNPVQRRRGETVRAVVLATVRPQQPVPLDTMLEVTRISRTALLDHLLRLKVTGRLKGYTTANGMVRVW